MEYFLVMMMRLQDHISPRAVAQEPDISWFDSRTKPGESYLMIDDCFVALKTTKAEKDLCYVQQAIKKQCGINYKMEKNCD